MGIKVNTNALEDLSEEIKNMYTVIEDISVSYRTNNYEILCDMGTEVEDELKIEMEKISKQIDDCCFLIKKHESFLFNSAQEYAETENNIVKNGLLVKNDLYFEKKNTDWIKIENSSQSYSDKEWINDIISILPVSPIWDKSFELSNFTQLKDINLIIDGYNQNVFTPSFNERLKILAGITAVIASSVLISSIEKITNTIIGKLTGFRDDNSENLSVGTFGGLNTILGSIGSAIQINYNYTTFKDTEKIIAVLLGEIAAVGIGGGGIPLFSLNDDKKEDEEKPNSEKEQKSEEEQPVNRVLQTEDNEEKNARTDLQEEETIYTNNTGTVKSSDESAYESNVIYGQNLTDNSGDELEYDKHNSNNLYSGYNLNNNESKKTEYETYKNNKDIEFSIANEHNSNTNKTTGSEAKIGGSSYSSGGISGKRTRVISDGGMGFSIYASSSEESEKGVKNIEYESAQSEMKSSEAWNTYRDSVVAYEKILSRNAQRANTNDGNGNLSGIGLGVAGTGAVGSAVAGVGMMSVGLGASVTAETGKIISGVMKCVIGRSDFNNLFDFVGKASRCNISWLSEITNILTI